MSQQPTCPKCQSSELRWSCSRQGRVLVDTLQCKSCTVTLAEEDWMAPMMPLIPGRCVNCGDRQEYDVCTNCGLSREEDKQVHDELRFMVSPEHTLFETARIANRAGRRLMALKLCTAAAAFNEQGKGDAARALRIWILAAIGDQGSALEDSKAWVESTNAPPAVAWASYGQQLQHGAFPGAAADAYHKALKLDARQFTIRARRAQLLMQLTREGQALDETIKVLEHGSGEETAIKIAISVAEDLCDRFEQQLRDDEIERLIDYGGVHVEFSAKLLGHRARLAAVNGDASGAKRDLKKARKLDPELDIYERVERAIKPTRTSWWRW